MRYAIPGTGLGLFIWLFVWLIFYYLTDFMDFDDNIIEGKYLAFPAFLWSQAGAMICDNFTKNRNTGMTITRMFKDLVLWFIIPTFISSIVIYIYF